MALFGEGKGPGCGFKFAGSRSRVPVRVRRSKPYGNLGAKLYDYDTLTRPPKYKYLCLPPYIGCYSLHLCLCTYSLLSCALLVIKYLCLVALVVGGKGAWMRVQDRGFPYAFGAQNHTVIWAPNCTTTIHLLVLQNISICVLSSTANTVPNCPSPNTSKTLYLSKILGL